MYLMLFVDGEFVGGCDIVLEMAEAGEFVEACAASNGKVKNVLDECIKSMFGV